MVLLYEGKIYEWASSYQEEEPIHYLQNEPHTQQLHTIFVQKWKFLKCWVFDLSKALGQSLKLSEQLL